MCVMGYGTLVWDLGLPSDANIPMGTCLKDLIKYNVRLINFEPPTHRLPQCCKHHINLIFLGKCMFHTLKGFTRHVPLGCQDLPSVQTTVPVPDGSGGSVLEI